MNRGPYTGEPINIAVLANAPAPYHVHFLTELADKLPEVRLHALFSHSAPDFDWKIELPPRLHPAHFAVGRESVRTPIWRQPWRELRKGATLGEYLRRHDVRMVICQGYNYLSYLRLFHGCHRRGIPAFLRADSNIRDEHSHGAARTWVKRGLIRWVLRHTAGVMPVGTLGQQYFRAYGAQDERIFIVPLTPDYGRIATTSPGELEAFRRARRLGDGRRRLLFVGRLAPVKRVDLLIDAFATVAERMPDWDLVIAGDGEMRDTLQARVPDHLRGRVAWLGFLQFEDIRLAYHAADVLVLPSDHEPWALVVNEALAAGLAVIASDVVGAAYDLIEHGINGYVFPRGDVSRLAEALLEVGAPDTLGRLQANVRPKLDEWLRRADSVVGVRHAMQSVGLLGADSAGLHVRTS